MRSPRGLGVAFGAPFGAVLGEAFGVLVMKSFENGKRFSKSERVTDENPQPTPPRPYRQAGIACQPQAQAAIRDMQEGP